MAFGISQSVRSREVQVCTPELFHQATKSSRVKDVCAQIEDALERKRRGEIGQEDYDTMKTRLKSQLPILTPHATFRNGRRLNADAIPSGLSIYDKDHIADPTGWWKAKSEELRVKNPQVLARILLVHVTPSLEGLRLVFVMPEGMNLAEAQKWMSQQLGDEEYDVCVKDLARPSFIVPEDYILFIDEARLFAPLRSSSGMDERGSNGDAASQANTSVNINPNPKLNEHESEHDPKPQVSTNQEHRPESDNSSAALPAGPAVEHAQSANHDRADDHHLGNHGVDQDHGGEEKQQYFAQEYDGISYEAITSKLVELLGGEPQHGSRNSFIFTLSCYLRYLCDDNATWIKQVIPTFGEEKKRAFTTVDSACQRKQSHRMPMIVRKAISLCQEERARGKAADYDADEFGDILNPDSYFYRIHEMPQKLPRLIRLLVSKTPAIYQPAVSQAVFPALASHLCDTRFRYIDNVEHEATLMNILCAPTGSGKESITQPINRIMADIRMRDAEQRERERAWKDECNRKGSNKDKRERPEGLVIQEVNIDMTNPAFVLRMKEAERHFLYAKVNELNLFDALKGKTNQHFRIMELAFDLGNYGQDRVGVQSVTETVKVRFNWNACCTPKKCRDYFRRVVTDGPVSRISFATIERRPCGSEIPVYGSYDASFDEELKPYIDNLLKARGLVDCPQALRLARKLMEENAEFARLSQNYVFENLSFRANVIAYLKACVLYVANGMKWEKSIEDFVRWSERYDLWCKLKLFGQMIYDADGEQDKVSRTAPNGPKNLLSLLPDEFTMDDYVKVRRAQGFDNDNARRIRDAIHQWVHRGYVAKVEGADTDTDSPIFRKVKG
uniref:BT4734/BF3469 family protein n=1 Tax=Prevotella sp. TaxID=59823 RepID=UPI004025BE5A